MRLSPLFAGFLLIVFAGQPVLAADTKKADGAEPGTSVEMPYLIAPVSSGDSLVAYAYITCKIVGVSQPAALEIREKVPFIQDAFVRDVNATSVAKPDDPSQIDQPALAARLLALARKVMGTGKVSDLKLTQVQISPIQPSAAGPNGPS